SGFVGFDGSNVSSGSASPGLDFGSAGFGFTGSAFFLSSFFGSGFFCSGFCPFPCRADGSPEVRTRTPAVKRSGSDRRRTMRRTPDGSSILPEGPPSRRVAFGFVEVLFLLDVLLHPVLVAVGGVPLRQLFLVERGHVLLSLDLFGGPAVVRA